MSAARSARSPTRSSPIWRTPGRPGPKSERQVQEANVVVLAAWSAQNPRILLNSATDKHPKGLANGSGLVGKYMMAHFNSGTWAMFDEDVQNHMGTTGAQFMSYERYPKTSHKGAFGSSFITAG